jgi:Skp family chaperone for outer membrane proteins
MKTLLITSAILGSILVPATASAQAIPGAVVAVVDLDRITADCNACKTARAALKSQATAEENREKSLAAPLQTEQKSIQAAVDALKGAEPDAALQARVKAFQTKAQQAQDTVSAGRAQLQANQAYIQKQISDKIGPVYQQVMTKRGINMMLEVGSTLAAATALDVTNDVLAGLNAAMPALDATAPAAAKQQAPQGR